MKYEPLKGNESDAQQNPDADQPANGGGFAIRLLKETELAKRWGCTVRKLQKDRLQGRGPPFLKIGGAIRYRLADIEEYESKCKYNSTSEYRA
jgi:hypothetical protein